MFTKLLIANRGEIAVRIIRTARRLGIATVAVHSTADSGALHVREADEAIDLGPGAASENYLNGAAIVAAAVSSGAQAVHPGYGFLAENAGFARAVADAGLVFVGPSPEAIEKMGEKVSARGVALLADVPLAPGTQGAVPDAESVREFGARHGYPVLIKAAYGGGGRGMRQVHAAEEVESAFDGAVREATAAFGNGSVYVERYLVDAHHVEVQVLGDEHGTIQALGDRDCSVQRRHQKLVEEAPAPGLSDATRAAMGEAAVRLSREVAYTGAGTVEFLVDGDDFYFLEMNTRVQVEHPVTEMVTGVDIVEQQLRVAAGEPLDVPDAAMRADGVAIEARINAEAVEGGQFRPAPGPIEGLVVPQGEGLRWDGGYEVGDEVLPFYDSLVGKLIAWGPDRPTAIARLRAALQSLKVEGISTTAHAIDFIVGTDDFRDLKAHTNWLETSVTIPDEEPPLDRSEVYVGGRYYRIPFLPEHVSNSPGAAAAPPAQVAPTGRGGGGRRGKTVAFDGRLRAPMQGTIVKVGVAVGDTVEEGQLLFVLEAMKMENPITAPAAGEVAEVLVALGDAVPAGTVLAGYAGA